MNRILLFIAGIIGISIICSCTIKKESEPLVLVPWPAQVDFSDGHFKLTGKTRVYISNDEPGLVSTCKYFIERVDELFGLTLETDHSEDANNQSPAVILVQDPQLSEHGDEGYHLEIDADQVVIMAKTTNGIFYGIQTLLQIIHNYADTQNNQKILLPTLQITDKPAFSWRGMHLDVSRHFFDKEFIKKYLDILAAHKMNVFHWHLTDDQGWRIEINKYPELTSLAAWRVDQTDKPWDYEVEITNDQDKDLYGGYYTQDDIREIVEYAGMRFITIVPEIEMPGHSQAVLTAYPHLSCSGKPYVRPDDTPFEFTDPFCAGNDSTFIFLQDVLLEMMELFPSEYIHIGGDEAKKTPWVHCSKCQALMRKEGLDDVDQLQSYFISEIGAFLESHGRKIIGWDEILEGGLAPGAAVMSWRGEQGGIEAASHGHEVVMTPGEFLYFNRLQDDPDPGASGNVLSIRDVYHYNPAMDVMGVQACLWTEDVQSSERAEYQLLPRLAALSEIAWTADEKKDWSRFHEQTERYYTYLDLLGTNYFIPPPVGLGNRVFYKDQMEISLQVDLKNAEIRYSLDGSDPDESASLYQETILVSENTVVTAKTFLPNGKSSDSKTGSFRKERLREPAAGSGKPEPGLMYKYSDGNIISLEQFNILIPADSGIIENFDIPPEPDLDFFGLEFYGLIKIDEEGVYTFYTDSDDGSRLYIHDELIVDNDGVHGANLVSGQIPLKAGYHPIEVIFFENRFGQHLKVGIEGPGMDRQLIHNEMLFH